MTNGATDFDWTPWGPHFNCWRGNVLPKCAGIYRIRRVGAETLDYVGQTGRNLRTRLTGHRDIYGEEMPFAAPHTAAPGLWAIRQDAGSEFEISVLPLSCSGSRRMAIEAYVISEHRQRFGHSPTVNFSRMPQGWSKSSNVSTKHKAAGRECRGARCIETTEHHLPGVPPKGLLDVSTFSSSWCGHAWSDWKALSDLPRRELRLSTGLYRIRGSLNRLVYIGQGLVLSRLGMHHKDAMSQETVKGRALASGGSLEASWVVNPAWSSVQLEELENDLIAAHYVATNEAPVAQFGGKDSVEDQQ